MPKSGKDFRAVLAALCLAAVPAAFLAGGDIAALPLVSGITVKIDDRPAPPDIESLVRISPGEPYSLARVDILVKQIYRTGLFSDIRVLKEGNAEVKLTFLLTRKIMTRKIVFAGERGVSKRRLSENLYAVRPDSVFSEDRLLRAAEELKSALRREGFLNASVEVRTVKDPALPLMDIFFTLAAGHRPTIESFDIVGDPQLQVALLKKRLASREGRPYIPSVLDEDIGRIKAFYGSRGYPRAEVALENPEISEGSRSVSLVLKVKPHERIRIAISGAKVPESLVRPIWEEPVFEEWALVQSEARVVSHVRNQGYVFATAKSSLEKSGGEIRVVHEVNSGRKYTIYDVDFEGLRHFTPAELKKKINIGFSLFGGIGGQTLFELPTQIERLYESEGFPETRIDLNFRKIGNDMRAIFLIEEGPRMTIGRLTLSGATLYDPETLRGQLTSAENGPYYEPAIRNDTGRLEAFYLDKGIRGTSVTAAVDDLGPGRFGVAFEIKEGRRMTIERIAITGNNRTRREVIERELKIKPGDAAFMDRIQETRRSLEKLGIFSEVKIEEIPISAESEQLVLNLREGEGNYFGLGVGLETKYAQQSVEIWTNAIRPRGTAELIFGNLFGRASQLSFVTQFSLKETRAVISWENRYLFGIPAQTSLSAWIEREERVSYGFEQRGVSFSLIKPLPKDWISYTTLRWASTTLTFLNVAESLVDRQHYPFSATSISESFIRDRRDDAFNPESGSFFSGVVEWAYPLFKAESNFVKIFLKYQRYWPVFRVLNFRATVRTGLGMGTMPIHERFFGGGSNSFRGQTFDRLGPEDPSSSQPIGGKALLLFNFEIRFPLLPSLPDLSGAVFYDKGNIFAERSDFNLGRLEDALGLGFRYRTPLGPVRIDFGWNFHPPLERKQPIVFITIGNVF